MTPIPLTFRLCGSRKASSRFFACLGTTNPQLQRRRVRPPHPLRNEEGQGRGEGGQGSWTAFVGPVFGWLVAVSLLAGCGRQLPTTPPPAAHKHEHHPPHGGTPVVLGNEEYHLELLLDNQPGIMDAYVLDDEMENFVRIAADSFQVTAKLPDRQEVLTFKAVANRATGETVGATSMFAVQADWLKTNQTFDGTLSELTVKGNAYRNVSFNFPKGNDTD